MSAECQAPLLAPTRTSADLRGHKLAFRALGVFVLAPLAAKDRILPLEVSVISLVILAAIAFTTAILAAGYFALCSWTMVIFTSVRNWAGSLLGARRDRAMVHRWQGRHAETNLPQSHTKFTLRWAPQIDALSTCCWAPPTDVV